MIRKAMPERGAAVRVDEVNADDKIELPIPGESIILPLISTKRG
jgi:hypothetical protein